MSLPQPQANNNNSRQHGHHNEEAPFNTIYSAEELKVLRECNLESFYFRSLPLSALLSGAAYYAMSRGRWKKSARFGYTPKMVGMAFLGYLIGKVSYTTECAEKFMKLPDSQIGEALRKKKGVSLENLSIEPQFTTPVEAGEKPLFDDHRPDLRDRNEGLDDYNKVTESLAPYIERTEKEQESFTKYSDLRKQNRDEHMQRVMSKYNTPTSNTPDIKSVPTGLTELKDPPTSPPPAPDLPSGPPPRRNKYGDIIE